MFPSQEAFTNTFIHCWGRQHGCGSLSCWEHTLPYLFFFKCTARWHHTRGFKPFYILFRAFFSPSNQNHEPTITKSLPCAISGAGKPLETQQQMFAYVPRMPNGGAHHLDREVTEMTRKCVRSSLLLPQLATNNRTIRFYLYCVRIVSWRLTDKNNVASFAHACQHRFSERKEKVLELKVLPPVLEKAWLSFFFRTLPGNLCMDIWASESL